MTVSRVLRTYYTLAGLWTLSASVIWGVNTLFLLDAGLNLFEVFLANGLFSAGMVLFEIPTGVVADTVGRRASFLLGAAVLALATVGYVVMYEVGAGIVGFAIVSTFMGLGFTFYSGAVEAWLVDALASTGHQGTLDEVFARGQIVTGAAMLVGTVGGGLLGQIDLAIPYITRAGLLVVLVAVAVAAMHDLGFTPRRLVARELPGEMQAVARDSIAFGWRRPQLRLLMLVGFVQTGFFGWGWYAWQPYFLELLGRDAVWVAGLVSALASVSMMAGNGIVEWVTGRCGKRTTALIGAAAVQTVAAVGIGLAGTFWLAVALLMLLAVGLGVTMPIRQSYIHQMIPTQQRATVLSFDSMVGGVGGVGGQFGLGALGEARSLAAGYVVGGAATVLALPLLFGVRRLGGPADVIVGADATPDQCTVATRLGVQPAPVPAATAD